MGIQGVTKGYRKTCFSWSILQKNLKLKISQFFDENDGLTPSETPF